MAKKVAGLDSPAKRARLAPSKNPYWASIGGSRAGDWLGYRRPAKGPGAWVAKAVIEKRKIEARIGLADDDGAERGALTYAAAAAAALT